MRKRSGADSEPRTSRLKYHDASCGSVCAPYTSPPPSHASKRAYASTQTHALTATALRHLPKSFLPNRIESFLAYTDTEMASPPAPRSASSASRPNPQMCRLRKSSSRAWLNSPDAIDNAIQQIVPIASWATSPVTLEERLITAAA